MNMHPPISTGSSTPLRWEEVISTFEPEFPQFADLARDQRAAGKDPDAFIDQLREVFRISRRASALERVFALSKERNLNLTQSEIELALDQIDAGLDEAAIIAEVERTRGGKYATWSAAVAAHKAAEAYEPPAGSPDEAYDEACDVAAEAHAALLTTPAPDLSAAAMKLSFAGEFMRFNAPLTEETAAELLGGNAGWTDRVIAATYLDICRLADSSAGIDPKCPAATIAAEIEDTLGKETAAEEASTFAKKAGDEAERERQHDLMTSSSDIRCMLEEGISNVQARSPKGIATQLAVAMHAAELVRGYDEQDGRDFFAEQVERLLKSVLLTMADHLSSEMWSAYVGGPHPRDVTHLQSAAA
jgi:chemotaxis protein histidine kinase CheA